MVLQEINRYKKLLREVEETGKKICEKLVETLKPVIPDIECTLGWAEAGVDIICLWSKSRDIVTWTRQNTGDVKRPEETVEKFSRIARNELSNIIEEVFPELRGHVDTPYGVYLTKKEAEQVRKLLRQLREQGG